MSDSQASSVNSKEIDGIVEQNEDFKEANGKIWRRKPEPLGTGGYSQVYLYENGRSRWAVKRIANISGGGRTSSAELENEKAALIKFSGHKRFVRFKGWFAHENIEYFALKYVQLGNLEDNLPERKEAGGCLPEVEVKTILTQILEGIEFMHAEGYIHRDLKPENILVAQTGPEWQVKITDLGLSKYTLGAREGYSFTGTPQYMAPEIYGSFLRPSDYTDAIDIWAVGCIACRMLIGKPPFMDQWLLVQYLKAIRESKSMDQLCKEVPYISKDLAGLLDMRTSKGLFIRQLLEPNPETRLSASQALGRAWLQGLDFCAFQGHASKYVGTVTFSRKGKLLASASNDGEIRLWIVEEGKTNHILQSPGQPYTSPNLLFLLDGKLVVKTKGRRRLGIWETEEGGVACEFQMPSARNDNCMAASPDGSLLAYEQPEGTIVLWDTEKRMERQSFKFTKGSLWESWIAGLTFSPNGKLIAALTEEGSVLLKDTESGSEGLIPKGRNRVVALVFSSTRRIIMLSHNGGIQLWDTEKNEERDLQWYWTEFDVKTMILSADGKLAMICGYNNYILIYDTERKLETSILRGHASFVESVAFSPDSRLLASASQDYTVRLWDVETGEERCILSIHTDVVRDVAFSPNGELVATASNDGIVGLWNVSRWKNRKDQEQSSDLSLIHSIH